MLPLMAWFAIFPPTELSGRGFQLLGHDLRLPAWWLRQTVFDAPRRCAGAVFAILPRVTWAGIRPMPSGAVGSSRRLADRSYCGRGAVQHPAAAAAYALVLMLSILVGINLALLVPAYATMVLLLASVKRAQISQIPVIPGHGSRARGHDT